MAQSDLQSCPRCGGTGIDPNPDGRSEDNWQWQYPIGEYTLFAAVVDWIGRKILGVLFSKTTLAVASVEAKGAFTSFHNR
jgi:hypothetical protein